MRSAKLGDFLRLLFFLLFCAFLSMAVFVVYVSLRTEVANARWRHGRGRLRRKYYIAANLHNNEPIMDSFISGILDLCDYWGAGNVFISIYENNSQDSTPLRLQELRHLLDSRGVAARVVTDEGDWKVFCDSIESPAHAGRCERHRASATRETGHAIRIPVMAAMRNKLLEPLWDGSARQALFGEQDANATEFSADEADALQIVFLNDIVLSADDVIRLVETENGKYDMVCALDFELLQFYDVWVTRDMTGMPFSGWYPFVREPWSRSRMLAGEPFPVYSCWNGMAAVQGKWLVRHGIRFRSWDEGEVRSPHPHNDPTETFRLGQCSVSECQLFCKDIWAAAAPEDSVRILIQPQVQVYYREWPTGWLQRLLMPWPNQLLFRWANRLHRSHPYFRSDSIRGIWAKEWDGQMVAPSSVTCGLLPEPLPPPTHRRP